MSSEPEEGDELIHAKVPSTLSWGLWIIKQRDEARDDVKRLTKERDEAREALAIRTKERDAALDSMDWWRAERNRATLKTRTKKEASGE